MTRAILLSLTLLCIVTAPGRAIACGAHGFYLNPDDMGFVGGAVVRMAGLAPPEPVFKLEHPAMARGVLNQESEIEVEYSRPFFSSHVRMEITGTSNVSLPTPTIDLDDRSGTLSIPFTLTGNGFDQITLKVTGSHKGKMVTESRRIYLRASAPAPAEEQQLSQR
ncbi:hypothetical protein BST95_10465 [Halioglobus japonicus]|uniref:Uncharacterized protein n=1 Tax=Halioglobus japonicus TaxID=930805 RepID=A0AAP8MEZ4_9GAMM|nr:hypothetical protein [Halioglobus japonicus]AQA18595.1 hypothetical protein BST95_10465 [Halioglobus japonicus]PLW86618.1 hypothetical protein C0029_09495 [Halioglobus japonicus]GHD11936.1 hypothetical protein GCM10007052_12220 [Halioglobus japonicus]